MDAEAFAEVDSWLDRFQRRYRVPGLALVVSDAAGTRHQRLSGLADRTGHRPLDAAQRWQIGSISKAFTAIAVLQLQRAGRLLVDDRLVDHLPWAEHLSPDVTLHHLLSHTAGLPSGSEWAPDSLLESVSQGAVGDPQPPGERYYYSNPGYELLGDVVEAVTGRPLERYLQENVLAPLGMTGASASVVAEDRDSDVRGHLPPFDDRLFTGGDEQVPEPWYPLCTADGAITATPVDLGHYLRFLLRGQAPGVVEASDFAALAARAVDTTDDGWYGYGLRTAEVNGRALLGHSGAMIAFFADVVVDRDAGLGCAVVANGWAPVGDANAAVLARLTPGLHTPLPNLDAQAWPDPIVDDAAGPDELRPMVGLYRAYNPWLPAIRVVRRDGGLAMADPVRAEITRLVAASETSFWVEHHASPDRIDFDTMVGETYLELWLSGCRYARVRRDPAGGL
ncbi:MAG: serine hydrolase domain-containing protein [Actinomycetes bacterium]